ncbi:MAG: hypothetical protein WCZ66_00490 [Sphingomonadaceae bacterium]
MRQMMMPPVAALSLALVLAGCVVNREARIRSALVDAGVPQVTARCMSAPLARDLSDDQLRHLGEVAKLTRAEVRDIDTNTAIRALAAGLDPATMSVMMRVGVGCLLQG